MAIILPNGHIQYVRASLYANAAFAFLRLTKLGRSNTRLELLDGDDLLSLGDLGRRFGLQQQPMAACNKKARSDAIAPIHMKTNILTPMLTLILSWSCDVRATLAATLMAVAIAAATVSITAASPPITEMNKLNQRVRITRGDPSSKTKLRIVPAMKKTYMTLDPMRRRSRIVKTSEGRAIWAPASNWPTRISTGLNQKNVSGGEQ